MGFVHLHTHTEYSLLDGSNKITEYVKKVKELGMNAATITDHGAMFGVIHFYKECLKNDIKPIIGCEVYVAPGSRFDKEKTDNNQKYYHLVLLAENNEGYNNLSHLITLGYKEGFYFKPRIDKEILKKYSKGLIASSACLAGEIPTKLLEGNFEEAKKVALDYQDIFGKGNFFLELQDHGIPEQKKVNIGLVNLSEELGIDLIATNDIHYTSKEDAESHDVLLCIQTKKKLSDEDRMRYEGGQFFVKSEAEMRKLFPYANQAIDNTQKIADRCNVEIEFGVTKLPNFEVPDGLTAWEYLKKQCFDGLEKRYSTIWQKINKADSEFFEKDDIEKYSKENLEKRLRYELDTIHSMGFVEYFLIVIDFINFARSKGIAVGPGRGSAAGSIVSYTLGITNIDPIKYDLLFERFLNPERVSMPDIDIDFCDERRSEVIEYVKRKYGEECVSQIATFTTLKARGVLRDVARVLEIPESFADKLAKMIPEDPKITLDKALEISPEFRQAYESDETVVRLVNLGKKLEGIPRDLSKHAAGVIISSKAVEEYVPLAKTPKGDIVTQYTKYTIEELGLLKMDFLGIKTLSVLGDTADYLKEQGIVLDYDNIDYTDEKTYNMITQGKTNGAFQLESVGMQNFMKQLKPTCMEDLIAGISLYRPGPMDYIPKYIFGKENRDNIQYDCPALKPILESTYGCIVYQEQVIQIFRDLAGFSMGSCDNMRRAISKKDPKMIAAKRKEFLYGDERNCVPGCIKNGIDEKTANTIYDKISAFAAYAFNKSHAAAYAVVAFQTAYAKANYPETFMSALMSSVITMSTKLVKYMNDCKSLGIEILPPDVNKGREKFVVLDDEKKEKKSIIFALSAIKSVGEVAISDMVKERKKNGKFTSFEDFVRRTHGILNRAAIENLIKCGALDFTGVKRKQMAYALPGLVQDIQQRTKTEISGQMNLMDFIDEDKKQQFEIVYPDVSEYTKAEIYAFEKELIGVYVSGHPLEDYREAIKKNVTNFAVEFVHDIENENEDVLEDKKKVVLAGAIDTIKNTVTKKNELMSIITLEDMTGSVRCLVFPQAYEKLKDEITLNNKVFVVGTVSKSVDQDSVLFVDKIIPINSTASVLWIRFKNKNEYLEKQNLLPSFNILPKGGDKVIVYLEEEKQQKVVSPSYGITLDDETLDNVDAIFGIENVEVTSKSIEIKI